MEIDLAGPQDTADLAQLLWQNASPGEREQQAFEPFAHDVSEWLAESDGFSAFIARLGSDAVGMAWVALVARVPRPGEVHRFTGDLQSVFVMPEERGRGIGSALVVAATEHAISRGASRVTVHSGRRATPIYERLGFASSPQLLLKPAEP